MLHLGGVRFPVTGPLRYSMTVRRRPRAVPRPATPDRCSPCTTRAGRTSSTGPLRSIDRSWLPIPGAPRGPNRAGRSWSRSERSPRLPGVSWPRWSVEDVLARRPAVRVNQLGYVPGLPMGATLVSTEPGPVAFEVVSDDDRVVLTGVSRPWPVRPEPTSGLPVHVLDLTGLPEGSFRVRSAPARQPSVRRGRPPVRRPRRRRPALLLAHAVGRPGRRARLRAPGRTPRGRRRARLDGSRRGGPLPRLARRRHVRRLGRLVRRRRLRQVHDQRRARGLAAARHARRAAARRPEGRRGARRVPLAARLAAADAGAAGPPARRARVPPRARYRLVAPARMAAPRPHGTRPAPAVDHRGAASRGCRSSRRPARPPDRSRLRRTLAGCRAVGLRRRAATPRPPPAGRPRAARRRTVRRRRRGRRLLLGRRRALAGHR